MFGFICIYNVLSVKKNKPAVRVINEKAFFVKHEIIYVIFDFIIPLVNYLLKHNNLFLYKQCIKFKMLVEYFKVLT